MLPLELTLLDSSNIHAVQYDQQDAKLYVHFKNGKMYTYHSVPVDVAVGLTHAPSPTQYLNNFIKGEYEYDANGDDGSANADA